MAYRLLEYYISLGRQRKRPEQRRKNTQDQKLSEKSMCPHLHTNLQVIISLYASSVSIKDLEDPYCNSKLLSQVYLFIFGTTLNSQIPRPPCSHLVAGLRRSDKCAQRCQILWCRESIAVIDNTLRCWKANHSRSPFSSVSASRKPRGQWLEGRYSSAVNRNSLLARFAQYGALMELSAHNSCGRITICG